MRRLGTEKENDNEDDSDEDEIENSDDNDADKDYGKRHLESVLCGRQSFPYIFACSTDSVNYCCTEECTDANISKDCQVVSPLEIIPSMMPTPPCTFLNNSPGKSYKSLRGSVNKGSGFGYSKECSGSFQFRCEDDTTGEPYCCTEECEVASPFSTSGKCQPNY